MKTKLLFFLFVIAAFGMTVSAQSVTITAKKVTYKRPKPISEYKKTFTINYPKIKAATPALSKKIESAISYEKVFDFTVKEELTELQWLESADYEVGYNANGMLSISLFIEGSGAYPSGSTKYIVVDLKTGLRLKPADLFSNTAGLLAKVKAAQEKEIADTIVELKKDPENKDIEPELLFKDSAEYQKVSLNEFSVDENGITFRHDYGFPHVVQALQPNGEFFFTWAQLKPYIKAGSLLSRVAR